ncbi:MAG TPA: PAS domain-containing protein [Steroidobacteraceae bacterium]
MRASLDSTRAIPRPVWERPRIHLRDDLWLLTIVAILLATGIPWYLSGFAVDVANASWGLLALGAVHIAYTMLGSPARVPRRWHERALTLLDLGGVIAIGFIWQHVGALQNPMFLLTFALPVIGTVFLSRWHPYLMATVSVLVVAVVALSQAPELRWYASGLFGGNSWLTGLLARPGTVAPSSFAGFYAPSNYLLVLLEAFTTLLFAIAVAAEYVRIIFERLNATVVLARTEAQRGQDLWSSLIEQLPLPALLIDPATLRIVAASEAAPTYLQCAGAPLEGRGLFEALHFSFPELIRELIVESDGGTSSTVIRLPGALRVAQVRALRLEHQEKRLALLTIEDVTERFCLKAALDTSDYASLVVDARGHVLALNKRAAGLFGSAALGMEAAKLLPQVDAGVRWWESGLTERRRLHLEIGPRVYQVTAHAVALAGEDQRIFTVSLLPVPKGGTVETTSLEATTITGRGLLR